MKLNWLNIGTSLAAIITAVIALFTLFQVKNQNEFAHRADIIVTPQSSEYSFSYGKKDSIVEPRNFINADTTSTAIKMNLSNIGLGTAKRIKVEWDLNYDNLIEDVKIGETVFQTNATYLEKSNAFQFPEIILFQKKKEEKDFSYILPLDKEKEVTSELLPIVYLKAWLNLFVQIVSHAGEDIEKCEQLLQSFLNENGELNLKVSYYDVFNKKHSKKFKVFLFPTFVGLEYPSVFLSVEVEEVLSRRKKTKSIDCYIVTSAKQKPVSFLLGND